MKTLIFSLIVASVSASAVGSEPSASPSLVNAIAGQLTAEDPALFDEARRALARIGDDRSIDALLSAIEREKNARRRAALVLAAGWQQNSRAADRLAPLLGDREACVAIAAAEALGRIASPRSVDALRQTVASSQGRLQTRAADSLLRCADTCLAAGKPDESQAIFTAMAENAPSRPIKLAAWTGKIRSSRDPAGLVVACLQGDDPDAVAVALGLVGELPADQLDRLLDGFDHFAVPLRAKLFDALATMANPRVLQQARRLADETDPNLHRAAIRALGYSKHPADVDVLLAAWRAGGGRDEIVSESLGRIASPGSDARIAAALEAAKSNSEIAGLLDIVKQRRLAQANPALLRLLDSKDAGIRSTAIFLLGELGGAGELRGMIGALKKGEPGTENDQTQRAIASVCERFAGSDKAQPLLDVARSEAERIVVLPVVGRIGGPSAKAAIEEAMAGEGALQEAGIRALCNWPDAAVADKLLVLAAQAPEPNHRIWALRAFIRVVPLPGGTLATDEQKLDAMRKAMALATRDDERFLVLDRLQAIRSVQTLRFVLPYLDTEPYVQQACKTVVELAHFRDLREPNKAEFYLALDKVIERTKDAELKDRAIRYRANQV